MTMGWWFTSCSSAFLPQINKIDYRFNYLLLLIQSYWTLSLDAPVCKGTQAKYSIIMFHICLSFFTLSVMSSIPLLFWLTWITRSHTTDIYRCCLIYICLAKIICSTPNVYSRSWYDFIYALDRWWTLFWSLNRVKQFLYTIVQDLAFWQKIWIMKAPWWNIFLQHSIFTSYHTILTNIPQFCWH